MLHQLTDQDKILEQVDLDPWLSRQEAVLGRFPDGNFCYRVYLDDMREIPIGQVRSIGAQIVYECNDWYKSVDDLKFEEPLYPTDKVLACEQRGMKER